jgi:hypothetical protein
MDSKLERGHLRKAESDIAKARDHIEKQIALMERLEADGHDTTTAQALLETMRETLTQMESHRDSILRELADMEKQGR